VLRWDGVVMVDIIGVATARLAGSVTRSSRG